MSYKIAESQMMLLLRYFRVIGMKRTYCANEKKGHTLRFFNLLPFVKIGDW